MPSSVLGISRLRCMELTSHGGGWKSSLNTICAMVTNFNLESQTIKTLFLLLMVTFGEVNSFLPKKPRQSKRRRPLPTSCIVNGRQAQYLTQMGTDGILLLLEISINLTLARALMASLLDNSCMVHTF